MIPVKIGMTIIITRFTTGPRPMNVWLWCFPFRIILALAFMVLVFITPLYQLEGCFIFSIFKYLIFKFIFCVRIVFHYLFLISNFHPTDGSFPPEYYVLMIFISAIHRAVLYGMFVAIMAFFARISDPVIIELHFTHFQSKYILTKRNIMIDYNLCHVFRLLVVQI